MFIEIQRSKQIIAYARNYSVIIKTDDKQIREVNYNDTKFN